MATMTRWILLLLTIGAFAGAGAYLHSRAGRPRPKSPAELAIQRKLPEMEFKGAKLEEVIKELETQAGVKIVVSWSDSSASPLYREMRVTLTTQGRSLGDAVVLAASRHEEWVGLRSWPEGDGVHLGFEKEAPQAWRVYNFSEPVARLCTFATTPPPLPWQSAPLEQQFLNQLPAVLRMNAGQNEYTRIGRAIVGHETLEYHSRSARLRDRLEQFASTSPAPDPPAALRGTVAIPRRWPPTLRESVQYLLAERVDYQIDWESLAKLGLRPDISAWYDAFERDLFSPLIPRSTPVTVEESLNALLLSMRHVVGTDERFGHGCATYAVTGNQVRIAASEDITPVIRRYSIRFLWTRGGQPLKLSDQNAFEKALRRLPRLRLPVFGLAPTTIVLGDEVLVIGYEAEHSTVRRHLEALREAWERGEDLKPN